MEITCFACQQKLQIADSNAGQMVRCPACAATFQAPSLPSTGPLPPPEPIVASPSALPIANAPVVPPDHAHAAPVEPQSGPVPFAAPAQPLPTGDFSGGFTITLRQHIVTLIPPIGLIVLIILSFFPWRRTGTFLEGGALNLWQLAFSAGFTEYVFYLLLLIVAAPVVFFIPLHDRKLLPTPAPLRSYLPWVPAVVVILSFASWFVFLTDYLQCTFMESIDPTTIWMKLAFRLHTLIVIAALLDLCLLRRKPRALPEPTISVRW